MARLGGEASVELDVPIDRVWAVVAAVERAPEWQKGREQMNVRERDGDGRVLVAESVSDAKVRQVRSVVRFTYEEPTRLSWRQESGDAKALEGAWELADLGDGRTRATYRLEVDPGMMLGMLIRGPVEERLREVLVGARPAELAARLGGERMDAAGS
jgi:uncharacterized protein YndB with AHSA1/START domain